MLYYRYRSYSELSLKELMYNEIYFSSTDECNDPFDSQTYYEFKRDLEKWCKLILLVCQRSRIQMTPDILQVLTEHLFKKSPISISKIFEDNIFDNLNSNSIDKKFLEEVQSGLRSLLHIYAPESRYFVSFSKSGSESLMWSHYAGMHEGFCLIFKAIDGKLNQCQFYNRRNIRRKTSLGFAEDMSWGFPDGFKFEDIVYKTKVDYLNAFYRLPVVVSGEAKSEQHRERISKEQQLHFYQKGKMWNYEKESRLVLPSAMSWLFGEKITLAKHERLFHFEPTQLVGIIYGARMSKEQKSRVDYILTERSDWIINMRGVTKHNPIRFDFVEFQSRLSANQRNVEIVPIGIRGYKTTPSGTEEFNNLYTQWRKAVGFDKFK